MTKRVFDEIHGHIELKDVEVELIDVPVFQRLRRIRQLTLAHLVYPGATHVRFSNSLGTMHLAGRVASSLLEKGMITKDEEAKLRIAALLINLGQMPLSHAIEGIFASQGLTSDELRGYVITNSEIREVLENNGFSFREILDIYENKGLMTSVLDSDVDVNRLDYLIRDSVHTGVRLGGFDFDRLLQTVTYSEGKRILVSSKGVYALEDFYIARLHMYEAVYYHKTILGYEIFVRRIFEELARQYYNELLEAKYVLSLLNQGLFAYWDDEWLMSRLYNALGDPDVSEKLKQDIKDFLNRRGPKLVAERISFEGTDPDFLLSRMMKLTQYGIPENSIIPVEEKVPIIAKGNLILESSQESLINSLPEDLYIQRLYVMPPFVKRARELLA
ncbi:MAG: HD domain-containing protein [Sulfolobales archaeon]|nr:HD domain-containing protein [Sulfolobales archaeon]